MILMVSLLGKQINLIKTKDEIFILGEFFYLHITHSFSSYILILIWCFLTFLFLLRFSFNINKKTFRLSIGYCGTLAH